MSHRNDALLTEALISKGRLGILGQSADFRERTDSLSTASLVDRFRNCPVVDVVLRRRLVVRTARHAAHGRTLDEKR